MLNELSKSPAEGQQRTNSVQNSVQGRRAQDPSRVVQVTKKWLDRLLQQLGRVPVAGREFWYDAQDKHYWIEVLPPNRVNHVLRWGKNLRRKVGEFPAMSVEAARKRIREYVVKLDGNEDPFDGGQRLTVAKVTLRNAVEQYVQHLKATGRRERGIRETEQIFFGYDGGPPRYRCFTEYLDRNLWRLKRDHVLKLHAAVKAEAQARYDGDGPMPPEYGHTVADGALRKLRAVIEVQRKRIDDEAKRPHNPVLVLGELKMWGKSERLAVDPFTAQELAAYIKALNHWPQHANPEPP